MSCVNGNSTFVLRMVSVLVGWMSFSYAFGMSIGADTRVNNKDTLPKQKTEIVALKNNLAYDAILTPNLQLEFRLTDQWSIEAGVGFNPFPIKDTKFPKWRHVSVSVAPRYWFCHVFNRGFFSFNAAYAHYNVAGNAWPVSWMYKQVKDHRYQGDAVMVGESFGWHFPISPHFSIELEAGIDVGYTWYKEYECKHCGKQTARSGHWFVLPKIGVNIVVPLGGDELSLARRCDCEKLDQAPEEPVDTIVEEEPEERIGASRLTVPLGFAVLPVVAKVEPFEVEVDHMQQLRSRLLRSEEEYEPYNQTMAMSADPRNTFIYFDVNVTKMDRSFIENDKLMDSIMTIIGDAVSDSLIRITHIQIVGYASFDGRVSYNNRLAGSRAQTIKDYIKSLYPSLPDSVFSVCNGGESWAELRYHLSHVEFEGRDEVFRIMDTEPDPDKREMLIKKLHGGATYRYMRDELKRILRNLGCITVFCEPVYD